MSPMHVDPFIDHHAQIALHQWRWLLPGEIVEPGHAQIADFQDVAETLGGNQPGLGAFQLQDGIRGHRGGVQHLLDVGAAESRFLKHGVNAIDDGPRIVVDAGGHFLGVQGAICPQKDNVGEGAANIHPNAKTWHGNLPLVRV